MLTETTANQNRAQRAFKGVKRQRTDRPEPDAEHEVARTPPNDDEDMANILSFGKTFEGDDDAEDAVVCTPPNDDEDMANTLKSGEFSDDVDDAVICTPPNDDEDMTSTLPSNRKSVEFSDRPTVHTFVMCNEEASSRRELSRSIKVAVKRARSGAPSAELAQYSTYASSRRH